MLTLTNLSTCLVITLLTWKSGNIVNIRSEMQIAAMDTLIKLTHFSDRSKGNSKYEKMYFIVY